MRDRREYYLRELTIEWALRFSGRGSRPATSRHRTPSAPIPGRLFAGPGLFSSRPTSYPLTTAPRSARAPRQTTGWPRLRRGEAASIVLLTARRQWGWRARSPGRWNRQDPRRSVPGVRRRRLPMLLRSGLGW